MPPGDVNISPRKTEQTNLDWSQATHFTLAKRELPVRTPKNHRSGLYLWKSNSKTQYQAPGTRFPPNCPLLLVLYGLAQCKPAERFNSWSETAIAFNVRSVSSLEQFEMQFTEGRAVFILVRSYPTWQRLFPSCKCHCSHCQTLQRQSSKHYLQDCKYVEETCCTVHMLCVCTCLKVLSSNKRCC